MTCIEHVEMASVVAPDSRPRLAEWFGDWLRRLRSRPSTLDPDRLSEHMRRDLGFATGRARLPRDPLCD